jgi:para-aminobenzoate synthetase/4-amino-4-deoxychorismate lyase
MLKYNKRMQIYNDKLFINPIKIIEAYNNKEFLCCLSEIEELKNKYYLIGYIRYNAKEVFLGNQIKSDLPLLYFEVYNSFENFKNEKNLINAYIFNKELINKQDYFEDIKKIKNLIKEGITYEVNYTYPVDVYTNLDELNLYKYLLNFQKTPYNCFIKNNKETLLSFSPELFFKIKDNKIFTKPMKGTIKRGNSLLDDFNNYFFLKNDIKNRSENIMIVDLIRNDLAKISKSGTIHVDKLFEIEKHKTLFQMTSEISSELKENITLKQILEALFPCGSITGAPKISTMKVIDKLERFKRDIYCGAIAYISPSETVFSVPIRILQKQNKDISYKYFSGGAIVWNSKSNEEWEETQIKRSFISCENDFQLIETMLVENGEIFLKDEHLNRLKKSCEFFNFKYNDEINSIKPKNDGILRLLVEKNGNFTIEYKNVLEIQNKIVKISNKNVNRNNIFLYHKTTIRNHFEESVLKIKNNEVFDEIYINECNEVTEGSRSNILIKKNGILYTPKVNSGLLNGCYRNYLLKNKKVVEKVLYKNDLYTADEIYCINSIRKMVKVNLL